MATRGEVINQTAPRIQITGSVSGSIDIQPALTPSAGNYRYVGTTKSNTARVIEYVAQNAATKQKLHLDAIVGTATITITNASGTQVHYRLGPKNPTSKGTTSSSRVTNKYVSQSIINNSGVAFTLKAPANTVGGGRPGSNIVTLRARAYKSGATVTKNGVTTTGISPNEKSDVVVVRFILNV